MPKINISAIKFLHFFIFIAAFEIILRLTVFALFTITYQNYK